MRVNHWFCVFLSGLLVTGCADYNNQSIGQVSGAAIGAILGNQIGSGSGRAVATIGGALIGSHIGNNIGRSLAEQDRAHLYESLDEVPLQHSRSWSSDHGERYTVTPVKTYRHQGRVCRRFKMTIMTGDQLETIEGRACRERAGHWRVIE